MKFSNVFGVVFSVVLLSACHEESVVGPTVILGEIEGDCNEVMAISYSQDNMNEYLPLEVKDGKFELSKDSMNGFADFAILAGEDVFGVRVNSCDTMRVKLTAKGNEHFNVEYDGKTERESRIWTDWYDVYGDSKWGQYNIRPDMDPDMTYDDSMNKLIENDSIFRNKYKGELDEYHIHRSDLMFIFLKSVLLEMRAGILGADCHEQSEYNDLFKELSPEDPLMVPCGLICRWASVQMYGMGENSISRNLNFMKAYENKIQNKFTRRAIAKSIANELSMNPGTFTDESANEYLEQIKRFAPDCADIVEQSKKSFDNEKATLPGNPVPDVKLKAQDGSETMLSSLFGKVLYIDVWATWCGPCCKEIPFLEKLVERFKDNKNISFVSLSIDDTDDPWLEKLKKDKPAWAQYRLNPEEARKFNDGLNIKGIPRFILLDADGRIINVKSPRPSSDEIDKFLNDAIK